jgi:hypothetical protein
MVRKQNLVFCALMRIEFESVVAGAEYSSFGLYFFCVFISCDCVVMGKRFLFIYIGEMFRGVKGGADRPRTRQFKPVQPTNGLAFNLLVLPVYLI